MAASKNAFFLPAQKIKQKFNATESSATTNGFSASQTLNMFRKGKQSLPEISNPLLVAKQKLSKMKVEMD
jgi:hypothetical protein